MYFNVMMSRTANLATSMGAGVRIGSAPEIDCHAFFAALRVVSPAMGEKSQVFSRADWSGCRWAPDAAVRTSPSAGSRARTNASLVLLTRSAAGPFRQPSANFTRCEAPATSEELAPSSASRTRPCSRATARTLSRDVPNNVRCGFPLCPERPHHRRRIDCELRLARMCRRQQRELN